MKSSDNITHPYQDKINKWYEMYRDQGETYTPSGFIEITVDKTIWNELENIISDPSTSAIELSAILKFYDDTYQFLNQEDNLTQTKILLLKEYLPSSDKKDEKTPTTISSYIADQKKITTDRLEVRQKLDEAEKRKEKLINATQFFIENKSKPNFLSTEEIDDIFSALPMIEDYLKIETINPNQEIKQIHTAFKNALKEYLSLGSDDEYPKNSLEFKRAREVYINKISIEKDSDDSYVESNVEDLDQKIQDKIQDTSYQESIAIQNITKLEEKKFVEAAMETQAKLVSKTLKQATQSLDSRENLILDQTWLEQTFYWLSLVDDYLKIAGDNPNQEIQAIHKNFVWALKGYLVMSKERNYPKTADEFNRLNNFENSVIEELSCVKDRPYNSNSQAETTADWLRLIKADPDAIKFNNTKIFENDTKREELLSKRESQSEHNRRDLSNDLNNEIKNHLGIENNESQLYHYISNHAHQQGFLTSGENLLTKRFDPQLLHFSKATRKYEFFKNDDDSITFIEYVTLGAVFNTKAIPNSTKQISVIVKSTIKENNGEIEHTFDSSAIVVPDEKTKLELQSDIFYQTAPIHVNPNEKYADKLLNDFRPVNYRSKESTTPTTRRKTDPRDTSPKPTPTATTTTTTATTTTTTETKQTSWSEIKNMMNTWNEFYDKHERMTNNAERAAIKALSETNATSPDFLPKNVWKELEKKVTDPLTSKDKLGQIQNFYRVTDRFFGSTITVKNWVHLKKLMPTREPNNKQFKNFGDWSVIETMLTKTEASINANQIPAPPPKTPKIQITPPSPQVDVDKLLKKIFNEKPTLNTAIFAAEILSQGTDDFEKNKILDLGSLQGIFTALQVTEKYLSTPSEEKYHRNQIEQIHEYFVKVLKNYLGLTLADDYPKTYDQFIENYTFVNRIKSSLSNVPSMSFENDDHLHGTGKDWPPLLKTNPNFIRFNEKPFSQARVNELAQLKEGKTSDPTKEKFDIIKKEIEEQLPTLSEKIKNYIVERAHQHGFTDIGQFEFVTYLHQSGILTNRSTPTYHFIVNKDNSITFVECVNIPLIDSNDTTHTERQVAIEVKSTIRENEGKIEHTLDSTTIVADQDTLNQPFLKNNFFRNQNLKFITGDAKKYVENLSNTIDKGKDKDKDKSDNEIVKNIKPLTKVISTNTIGTRTRPTTTTTATTTTTQQETASWPQIKEMMAEWRKFYSENYIGIQERGSPSNRKESKHYFSKIKKIWLILEKKVNDPNTDINELIQIYNFYHDTRNYLFETMMRDTTKTNWNSYFKTIMPTYDKDVLLPADPSQRNWKEPSVNVMKITIRQHKKLITKSDLQFKLMIELDKVETHRQFSKELLTDAIYNNKLTEENDLKRLIMIMQGVLNDTKDPLDIPLSTIIQNKITGNPSTSTNTTGYQQANTHSSDKVRNKNYRHAIETYTHEVKGMPIDKLTETFSRKFYEYFVKKELPKSRFRAKEFLKKDHKHVEIAGELTVDLLTCHSQADFTKIQIKAAQLYCDVRSKKNEKYSLLTVLKDLQTAIKQRSQFYAHEEEDKYHKALDSVIDGVMKLADYVSEGKNKFAYIHGQVEFDDIKGIDWKHSYEEMVNETETFINTLNLTLASADKPDINAIENELTNFASRFDNENEPFNKHKNSSMRPIISHILSGIKKYKDYKSVAENQIQTPASQTSIINDLINAEENNYKDIPGFWITKHINAEQNINQSLNFSISMIYNIKEKKLSYTFENNKKNIQTIELNKLNLDEESLNQLTRELESEAHGRALELSDGNRKLLTEHLNEKHQINLFHRSILDWRHKESQPLKYYLDEIDKLIKKPFDPDEHENIIKYRNTIEEIIEPYKNKTKNNRILLKHIESIIPKLNAVINSYTARLSHKHASDQLYHYIKNKFNSKEEYVEKFRARINEIYNKKPNTLSDDQKYTEMCAIVRTFSQKNRSYNLWGFWQTDFNISLNKTLKKINQGKFLPDHVATHSKKT